MTLIVKDVRRIEKYTEVPNPPLVAPSSDHTDGSWNSQHIYKGELYIDLVNKRIYTSDGATVFELKGVPQTFAEVLLSGNTTGASDIIISNTQVIKAASGGGQLNLRVGADNVIELTNDNGGYGKAWFYGDTISTWIGFGTDSELYLDDSNAYFKMSNSLSGILKNDLTTRNTNANPQLPTTLSSESSIINQSVINSVLLGGTLITMKTDNTAYVNQIGFNTGLAGEMILAHTPSALDFVVTLQAATGTIALLSDTTNKLPLAGGIMSGDIDFTTNSVAPQTNKIKTTSGRLDWLAGLDSLIHDFTSWVGGGGVSFTQTWRNKSGTVAHTDDIQNNVLIDNSEPTHTGNTTETVMKTIEIPPLAVGDYFETNFMCKKETVSAQMFNKVRVGPNPTIAGSVIIDNYNTNVRTHKHTSMWFVKSDTQIMSLFNRGNNNVSGFPNGGNTEIESALLESMDRTITNYIMFTSQLDDDAELVTNHFSMVEIKKKAV